MKLCGAMFRSHSIFVLSFLALAADASLGNVTVHHTAVKPPAAKDQKAEIEALRMQLEKVSFGLTVTSHHPGGSLAESKTTDAALALAEQLKTTDSSDAKALKRLQDAQEAVQSFTKDLTVEQSSFLKKESDEQVQSLLLDTLWRVDNQPFAQQLQVLQSDVFQNLAVVQAVLALKDMTTPLLKQVYCFLDKHFSTSPAYKAAAKTKRDNVSVLKMQAMPAPQRFANSTSQLDKSSTQQLVNSSTRPLEFSSRMKNRPLIILGPLALSNRRLDNSSTRQSLGQLKAKVNSTTRELDNSSIREPGNSTTRRLNNSSIRMSLVQLKVEPGFLSLHQMPAMSARQTFGSSTAFQLDSSSTRLSLDQLKAKVNSTTRQLDNSSTRLSFDQLKATVKSTIRRLDKSSTGQSLDQVKTKVNSTTRELDNSSIRELVNSKTRRLNNSSTQLFLGQLGQLKVDRGFLSLLQMPTIPAHQSFGNSTTRRPDNSSTRQSLDQVKTKVNSTTRELDNSSIREPGNSSTRRLDNSSARLSLEQLKVKRGFLSVLQMPAIPAGQRLGNSSTRLSLDQLKATVNSTTRQLDNSSSRDSINSKTRRLDNLSTRLSQSRDHA